MHPTTIILITGYPAAGKTTFAHYLAGAINLPLLCKDELKEVLFDHLGWDSEEWVRKLGAAAWALFYHQVELLLAARVNHIAEANFDPRFDNDHWQRLAAQYDVKIVQVRCECDADVLMMRDEQRIQDGNRHPGHVRLEDPAFYELVKQGPIAWIDVAGERISLDTTVGGVAGYAAVVERLRGILGL